MNTICTVDDEFIRDNMRWVVVLSNGKTVYQDDNRPGLEEPSAWIRLRNYCKSKNVFITEMWLQFRSNRILIEPKNAAGYFFVKSAWGVWGDDVTYQAYVMGVVVGNEIRTTTWKIPELEPVQTDTRPLDSDSLCLILRDS